IKGVDRRAQEDSRQLMWSGTGPATVSIHANPPLDLSRETTGQLSLVVDYRVDSPPTAPVTLGMSCGPMCGVLGGSVPIGGALRSSPVGEWRTLTIPLGCLAKVGSDMTKLACPFAITTSAQLTLTISAV